MKTSSVLILVVVLCACTTASHSNGSSPDIAISVTMRHVGDRPVALIELRNSGSGPVAVSKTFGYRDLFLNLEFRRKGEAVRTAQWELFREPPYACLEPGEAFTVAVPIDRWKPVIGVADASCDDDTCLSYPLTPGSYEVRAVYREPRGGENPTKCTRIIGTAHSPVVTFSVPE